MEHLRGMRLGQTRDLFGRVILAICLQMAPLKRSRQMMGLLLDEFGTKLDFDGREVEIWPSPEEVVATGPAPLRERAKLGYRAERLVAAAAYLVESGLTAADLEPLSNEDARRAVMAIPYSVILIVLSSRQGFSAVGPAPAPWP